MSARALSSPSRQERVPSGLRYRPTSRPKAWRRVPELKLGAPLLGEVSEDASYPASENEFAPRSEAPGDDFVRGRSHHLIVTIRELVEHLWVCFQDSHLEFVP